MNKKTVKKILMVLAILTVLVALSGCDILGLFGTATVQVTNYFSWTINVYYRETGTTTWSSPIWVGTTNNEATFDLPAPGIYDFMVQDWVSDGSYIDETVLAEDCSGEYGDIDYYMSVSSTGTVSVY